MNLEALKAAKKKAGLTIAQIAERANLPKGTVQNIFCGYVPNPRSDTLQTIEQALGLKDMYWTDEERVQGVGQHPITLSAEEWDWLELRSELIRTMGEDYQKTVKKMLEEIVKKNN